MIRQWMTVALAVCALGCAKDRMSGPQAGSQTHFLSACSGECPAPYECLCGMCSLACTDDRVCEADGQGALCISPATAPGGCSETEQLCDVECTADAQCETIADYLGCVDGRCRQTAPATRPDGDGGAVGPPVAADAGGGVGGSGGGSGGDGGAATGDAGDGTADAGQATWPLSPLCDGSDDIRLYLSTAGGALSAASAFAHPDAVWSYVAVDGHCRFYASSDYYAGIATGTLTAEQTEDLAGDLRWSDLEVLAFADQPCPDGGTTSVIARGAVVSAAYCSCGCDADAPVELQDMIARAQSWLKEMPMLGSALPATVKVSAFPVDPSQAGQEIYSPWPLARPMAEIDGLITTDTGEFAGVRIDDPDEAKALRELRQPQLKWQSNTFGETFVGVLDEEGAPYELYVVDELPADVVESIDTLRATAPL